MPKRTVSLDELDNFEVDEDGRLYWQGDRVLTDVRLSLSRGVNAAVVLAGIGTFGLFLLSIGQAAGVISAPAQKIELTIQHEQLLPPKSSEEGGQS